jgi:hypothetical protein
MSDYDYVEVPREVLEDAHAILTGGVEVQREAFNSGATARVVLALWHALAVEDPDGAPIPYDAAKTIEALRNHTP